MMPMQDSARIAIMGKHAAGKGTQSSLLSAHFGLSRIAVGEMLRGLQYASRIDGDDSTRLSGIDKGDLAPEDIVRNLVSEAIEWAVVADRGFILDGFPRTVDQVRFLQKILPSGPLDAVIYLKVSDEVALSRLEDRVACEACGETSSHRVLELSGKQVCSRCGGRFVARPDDSVEVATRRLRLHNSITGPVIEIYRAHGILEEVDGTGSPSVVFREIVNRVEALTRKHTN